LRGKLSNARSSGCTMKGNEYTTEPMIRPILLKVSWPS
jgi:hypothetical protein